MIRRFEFTFGIEFIDYGVHKSLLYNKLFANRIRIIRYQFK